MTRWKLRKLMQLAVAAAMIGTMVSCERLSEKEKARPIQAVTRVEVVRPERHTVQRAIGEPGQLESYETTPIHAKVAGYVLRVHADIGSAIKKGQLLAELFVPELDAEYKQKCAAIRQAEAEKAQAESAVLVAQAGVKTALAKLTEVRAGTNRAEAELSRWQSETNRVTQLVSDRAVSGSLLDETRSKLHAAESACEEVRAHVKSAEAAVIESRALLDRASADVFASSSSIDVAREDARRAQAMLGYAKIEAPYDGVVIRRTVDTGHLTKPGADAAPLFVVARLDIVTVVIDIPETYSTDVQPGQRAHIKLQAMKGRTIEANVTRTAWALDSKTRTIRTEIDLPNPEGKLRPGLYAYATVIVEEHKDVMTIPTTAVIQENDKAFCVVVANEMAARKPIEIGLNDGARTEVISGLVGNEAVVKANASSLSDGQAVKVQDEIVTPGKP